MIKYYHYLFSCSNYSKFGYWEYDKIPQIGWLNRNKFLTIWGVGSPISKHRQVRDPKMDSFLGPLRTLSLSYRWLFSQCVFTWSFLCACTSLRLSVLIKTLVLGPLPLWLHLALIISLKVLSPNTVKLRARTSTCESYA